MTKLRILGPVEYFDGVDWLPIASAKQRGLLASLIVHGNQVVSADRLLAELWPDRPSAAASGLLAGCVWRLRKRVVGSELLTRAPGYQLVLSPGVLDVHDYERLAAAGRASAAAGDMAAAAESFRQALAVWRDVPLADVAMTPALMAERSRLEESQASVLEARIEAEISLGYGDALLPELRQLVALFPLRERLHAHLMLVSYQCGHQADALSTYRNLRRLLVNELGIEPNKPLRELHQRILSEDPTLARPRAPAHTTQATAMPAPPSVATTVVGQDDAFAAVTQCLTSGERVCAVHGLAGAGTTTLLLRARDALAEQFPDGQIYVDVHGSSVDPPMTATEVLRVAGWTPGRRTLVVLDDIADARQVQPLLTPPPGCAVLLGGRAAIDGIPPGGHVHLKRLSVNDAVTLLRDTLGAARVDADRTAASAIARLCDHSPLALTLAAAKLATRPQWTLREFAERLADPRRRLDLLAHRGRGVRASLDAGIRLLHRAGEHTAITTLHLLGALDVPIVSTSVLATLADTHPARAETIADRLVDAGLVERLRIDTYRVTDTVRLFAREQQPQHLDTAAAVARVIDYYIAQVHTRTEAIRRGDKSRHFAWYRHELGALRVLGGRDYTDTLPKAIDEFRWLLSHNHPRRMNPLRR